MATRIAAIDLGAESGRVILATLEGGKLALEPIHRFPSPAVRVNGTLRWDVLSIWSEIMVGLRKLVREHGPFASVGVDSWGVDYVLLRDTEPLLTLPFHYRDRRTEGAIERAEARIGKDDIFRETGIQFMPINTVYQLHDDATRRPETLQFATGMLMIADYFNWLLGGVARGEETLASTSQLFNPVLRSWSGVLAQKLSIPLSILPQVVPAGTVLGPVTDSVKASCRLEGDAKVIATCSHDTAAAVAAVPATGADDDWAYLSSGTWSLLGAEVNRPVITEACQRLNFTNEVGFGGTIRLLKNIIGLWPLQECKREWEAEENHIGYAGLAAEAATEAPHVSILDLTDPRFAEPGNMLGKVADFCRETGQPTSKRPATIARAILESLALQYRRTLGDLEQLLGRKVSRLHIVGGGSQNKLLNQMAADATGVPVVAGPAEATAIGNALVQAIALGQIGSLGEARRIVVESFPLETYHPRDSAAWAAAADKLASFGKH